MYEELVIYFFFSNLDAAEKRPAAVVCGQIKEHLCCHPDRLNTSTAGAAAIFHVHHLSTSVFHRGSENNKLFHAAPPGCAFILLLFGQWSHLSFSEAEVKIHDVKKKPPPLKKIAGVSSVCTPF